jgi:nucleoid-associated protein YgaU
VAAAPVVVEEGPKKLVIQPGNNLWKLSREVYGKGRMFTIIYEANRDQLKNPNKIFPGQILTAPKQN